MSEEIAKETSVYESKLEQRKSNMTDYLAEMPGDVRKALYENIELQMSFYSNQPPCIEGLIAAFANIGLQTCLLEGIRSQID
jgi:hypothetical protein